MQVPELPRKLFYQAVWLQSVMVVFQTRRVFAILDLPAMSVIGVSYNSEKSCVKHRIAIGRENTRFNIRTHGYQEVGLSAHKRVDGKIV